MPAYITTSATAYGARTIVCRLEGAVEVSDSEMLSKVPSLRKLALRSSELDPVRFLRSAMVS